MSIRVKNYWKKEHNSSPTMNCWLLSWAKGHHKMMCFLFLLGLNLLDHIVFNATGYYLICRTGKNELIWIKRDKMETSMILCFYRQMVETFKEKHKIIDVPIFSSLIQSSAIHVNQTISATHSNHLWLTIICNFRSAVFLHFSLRRLQQTAIK